MGVLQKQNSMRDVACLPIRPATRTVTQSRRMARDLDEPRFESGSPARSPRAVAAIL